MMITSAVNGRLRVRCNRLKARHCAQEVADEMASLEGVSEVRVNRAAGSLVVSFDASVVDPEALETHLEASCLAAAAGRAATRRGSKTVSKRLNQATKVGMVTTLGTSLTYGVIGRKKEHIAFGSAFLALAGMHMLRYRRTLVR